MGKKVTGTIGRTGKHDPLVSANRETHPKCLGNIKELVPCIE
jgi:hypothetical protein